MGYQVEAAMVTAILSGFTSILAQPMALLVVGLLLFGASTWTRISSAWNHHKENVAWQEYTTNLENGIAQRDGFQEALSEAHEADLERLNTIIKKLETDLHDQDKPTDADVVILGPDDVRVLNSLRAARTKALRK